MSNALLEAMSHGLPSITTAYKGSSDIIKSGYNGIIVPKRDVKSLADAMLDLYLDENKRLRIGQNAKQTIVDDFKQDIVVSKWIKSIKEEL
jgi:glycosyltransferase involved in cell wall biosynthesis